MSGAKLEAPFWHNRETMRGITFNRLIACAMLLILPAIRYGLRVVTLTAGVVAVCCITEIIMCLLLHCEVRINDFDSIVTGMMITALMPVNVPFYVPMISAVFALVVVKMPFGGTGHAPFSAAAAGVAFATLSFPTQMFTYASVESGWLNWNFFENITVTTGQSLSALLKAGVSPTSSYWSILTGNLAGPIGTASVLVLAGAAIFLFGQRAARWEISVAFILAAGLMAMYNPRVSGDWMRSIICELSSGSLLFCSIFLVTEYSTTPDLPAARWVYGALGGVLAMLFRWYGAYEQGACFSILILNVLADPLDRVMWKVIEWRRKRHGKE